MKAITVFTTTYNRAFCLNQLYNSLVQQTNQNFLWLVIDDGSTDATQQIIANWKIENKIEIHYIYQENKGMHSGHNLAYDHIETEFNVCIDSDDYMPNNAIELILKHTSGLDLKFAGIVGLDATKNGQIIGTKIPETIKECTLNGLYQIHGVKGDKKLVYRTAIIKQYPKYPIFEGEKFVPLGFLYYIIDKDYLLKPVNEIFAIVEYQQDGSTKNILKQYRKNPRGFAFSRISRIQNSLNLKDKIKNSIHLISNALFAKDFTILTKSGAFFWCILLLPLGLLLHVYILYKTQK